LLRKKGFQGLRDGLTVIRRIIEDFWSLDADAETAEDGTEATAEANDAEKLRPYPAPDPDDGTQEGNEDLARVAPIAGLNGEGAEGVLLMPIRQAEVTDDTFSEPFNYFQYTQCANYDRLAKDDEPEKLHAQEENMGFKPTDFDNAVAGSKEGYYPKLIKDVSACIEEYKLINSLLTERCTLQVAPPTSKIIELLEEIERAVRHFADKKFPAELEEVTEIDEDGEVSPVTSSAGVLVGPVKSRAEAFKQLDNIAEFFLKSEPHSPISYVLQKAIKWGDMSLDELMNELIPDSSPRTQFSLLTGVSDNAGENY